MSSQVTRCIHFLPDELLINIFKYLPLESILCCEKVSQRWRKLTLDPAIWRRMDILYSGKPGQTEVSEKILKVISSHKDYIYCLKVQYVYSYSIIKTVIEQCKNLISIELVMCRISTEFKDDILKWPNLKKINLKNSILLENNKDLLIQFALYKDLKYLELSDFGLSQTNCATLLNCSHLTHIYIEKIKSLDKMFITDLIISKTNIIKTLHIYGSKSIEDNTLKLLSKCPLLQDLAIIRCEYLTDEGLISLASLASIHSIQIWNSTTFSESALLKTLSSPSFIRLKRLSLSRIENVTPAIVDVVSEYYKNLKFLALYQCKRVIDTDYEKQLETKFRNIQVVLY